MKQVVIFLQLLRSSKHIRKTTQNTKRFTCTDHRHQDGKKVTQMCNQLSQINEKIKCLYAVWCMVAQHAHTPCSYSQTVVPSHLCADHKWSHLLTPLN